MAEEKKEAGNTEQPFPDCRPSIEGDPDFDEDTAKAAAKTLRQSMKGLGTNERKIVEVTNAYNHAQRMVIKQAFAEEYNRNLIKDFESELSSNFEKMVVGLWMDPGRFDAKLIEDACSGMGTDEDLLTEVICTRSNRELDLAKAQWKGKHDLVKRVKGEIKGSYEDLLVAILEGSRADNGPADMESAKKDAEELNRLLGDNKKQAKAKFVEVFSTRSFVQIQTISAVFQDIAKKYTMAGAIDKAFGDGDTGTALKTIDEFCTQPYDFWAKKLRSAMKGMGTDDSMMRRVLVSRSGIDMRDIGIVFGQRYGDGKTLAKWIKDDLSGDYEKLCLAVCGLE